MTLGSWAVNIVILLSWAGVCVICVVQLIQAMVARKAAWCGRERVLMVVVTSLVFTMCLFAYMPDDFPTTLGIPEWLLRPAWEYGPERRASGFCGMLLSGAIGLCAAVDGLLCVLRK